MDYWQRWSTLALSAGQTVLIHGGSVVWDRCIPNAKPGGKDRDGFNCESGFPEKLGQMWQVRFYTKQKT